MSVTTEIIWWHWMSPREELSQRRNTASCKRRWQVCYPSPCCVLVVSLHDHEDAQRAHKNHKLLFTCVLRLPQINVHRCCGQVTEHMCLSSTQLPRRSTDCTCKIHNWSSLLLMLQMYFIWHSHMLNHYLHMGLLRNWSWFHLSWAESYSCKKMLVNLSCISFFDKEEILQEMDICTSLLRATHCLPWEMQRWKCG